MQQTRRLLLMLLYVSVALTALFFVLSVWGRGLLHGYTMPVIAEFYATATVELVTICVIPLALRLFKAKSVRMDLCTRKETALRLWGTLRMAMICLPMIANAVLYFVTYKTAFAYLAIILLICLFFIYPSKVRCQAEVTLNDE